jgi:hypothetical protein
MGKNKVTTVGYFVKRMRDSGYVCDKIFTNYKNYDCRSWTVIIDPGHSSVFITCINNKNELGEEYFEIHDSGQYIPENFKIKTSSIEVVIEYLVKFGINNKSKSYNEKENRKNG